MPLDSHFTRKEYKFTWAKAFFLLLCWLVTSGLALHAFQNPYFVAFMDEIFPREAVPHKRTWRNGAAKVGSFVKNELVDELAEVEHCGILPIYGLVAPNSPSLG